MKYAFYLHLDQLRINSRLIFANVIRCSRLRLRVGYFIYFCPQIFQISFCFFVKFGIIKLEQNMHAALKEFNFF